MFRIDLSVKVHQVLCDPETYLWGTYRDSVKRFRAKFTFGHLYHLDSDFSQGGWALNYFLAGRMKPENIKYFKNKNIATDAEVKYCGKIIESSDLEKLTCYVGNYSGTEVDARRKLYWPLLQKRYYVRTQIADGLRKSNSIHSFEEIERMFCLSDGRLDRLVNYTSGEIWRSTLAIGYASGKRIFCFPQMTKDLMYYVFRDSFVNIIKEVKKNHSIIIVPTIYPDPIRKLIDKSISMRQCDYV
jgi:hypothetical protein